MAASKFKKLFRKFSLASLSRHSDDVTQFISGLQISFAKNMNTMPKNREELEAALAQNNGHMDEELMAQTLQVEYEYLRYENCHVPDVITDEMWAQLRQQDSAHQRRALYKLWWLKEMYREKRDVGKRAKLKRQEESMLRLARDRGFDVKSFDEAYGSDGHPLIGPVLNLLQRLDLGRVKKQHAYHMHYALNFGQPLVFDLGIPYKMNSQESSSFVKQMRSVYSFNRAQWEPYNIYLCNYDSDLPGMRELTEGEQSRGSLWNVTPQCFSEIFPRDRLVYLTPDAPEAVTEYRHDDVYIIGGVVDKSRSGKYTLSKVNEMGIRSLKFDLNRFFKQKRAPLMTLDIVFCTLLDARDTTGNWMYSYRHLPRRMVEWRSRYDFMNECPGINEPHDSRMFKNHRAIFKPTRKTSPYSTFLQTEPEYY